MDTSRLMYSVYELYLQIFWCFDLIFSLYKPKVEKRQPKVAFRETYTEKEVNLLEICELHSYNFNISDFTLQISTCKGRQLQVVSAVALLEYFAPDQVSVM